MHSFFGLALVSVVWVIVGFSLAFAPDVEPRHRGLIGGLDFAGFMNVGLEPSTRSTAGRRIPFVLFASFQLMFAAITPALITGAFAERKRFGAFVAVHHPLVDLRLLADRPLGLGEPTAGCSSSGALDFAGGTVVHASAPASRPSIVALLIGRRVVNGDRMEPHDIPMTVLGAGLLWFGWFGFNAGSALAADGLAANALHRHQHRGRRGDDHLGPRELPPQRARSASSAPPAAPSPASSRSRRRPAS